MIVIFLLIGLPVLIGAIVCRWTQVHPLAIGLLMGAVGAIIIAIGLVGIVGVDKLGVVPIIALFPAAATTLGGVLGWLRRKHVERMN